MHSKAPFLLSSLLLLSCTGVRSVQLRPPAEPPPGLIWGYGAERLRDSPERGRQSAYLKAIDDLLMRGPVLVSKTVQDRTTVIDLKPASRTMEATFRLRASRLLQPSFMEAGVEDGFVWVLVGTTEDDIEKGWLQFVEWRREKIAQAERLYHEASGRDRVPLLRAAFALLEEAGAQDDPGLLYYEVKTALDAELRRVAELENLQKRSRSLIDSGELAAADQTLDQALRLGMDEMLYQQFKMEIVGHRSRAAGLIAAGDDLFRSEQYNEALDRYRQARRLDRDHPELPTKLAMAERYHRTARRETVRSAVNVVGWSATRVLGEYFRYKREQEARKKTEEAKKAPVPAQTAPPATETTPPAQPQQPTVEDGKKTKRERILERIDQKKDP